MDNRAVRIRNSLATLVIMIAVFFITGISTPGYADDGLNVTKHSKSEIIERLNNSGVSFSDPVNYSTEPVKNTVRGEMTSETKNSALAMLNNVRYIAGLDPVSLDPIQSNKAQAAAFVMWSTGQFTHYISGDKPSAMSEEDWNMGVEGARNSNIGWGYQSLNGAIVKGWMEDSDEGNVSRVGHRRWCLNPEMSTTGFGKAGAYSAMWSSDERVSSGAKRVAWPAAKMPVEYFGDYYPWSLSTGDSSISDVSNVSVSLTRRASSPSGSGSWTFSTSKTYTASDSGEYFSVAENNPYKGYSGQGGPYVVFRPANINYKPGDIFDVSITGLGSDTISYTVEFFSGYSVESIAFDKSEYILTSGSTTVNKTINPKNASGYEITWSTGDESIAKVNSNGILTRVAPGVTTVTATISGKYTYDGKPRTATAVVRVPKSITSSDITYSSTSSYVQYTGSLQRPDITIKDNGVTLKENIDYEIIVPDNAIEPGSYAYSIKGIGSYYGTKNNLYLVIQKKDPDEDLSASDKAAVSETTGKLGVTKAQAIEINNFAKANGISQDTLNITESAITGGNTDSDLKGSKFGQLQAFAKKNTKNSITLQWKKVKNADGYLVYGNKCGKNNKMKLLGTFKSGKTLSYTNKKLKKGTYYKYIVIAYKDFGGTKVTVAASPTIHSVTKGGKYGVAKSVSIVKVGNKKSAKLVLKRGKTAKIKAKEIKEDKKIKNHRKLSYESSNPGVASVSRKGVIKAVGKGKCRIYVYAQNGKQKTISVTVP